MQESVMTALFGAMSNEHRMAQITNNLANVNTTGYKRDVLAFKDTFMRFAHDYVIDERTFLRGEKLFPKPDVMSKVRLNKQRTDFTQGNMVKTGNRLDLAIQGNGFFKIRTPDGDFYTRNGNFVLGPGGTLRDNAGNAVLGQGGPITIPPNTRVSVGPTGEIFADAVQVDSLDIATVTDRNYLEKIGGNLYRIRPGSDVQEVEASFTGNAETGEQPVTVNQGFLETANVNVVEEMVNMIEVQRAFEAYQKVMQTSQQQDTRVLSTVAR